MFDDWLLRRRFQFHRDAVAHNDGNDIGQKERCKPQKLYYRYIALNLMLHHLLTSLALGHDLLVSGG